MSIGWAWSHGGRHWRGAGVAALVAVVVASVLNSVPGGLPGAFGDEPGQTVLAVSRANPIKHVIVIELENHSFDNYFGSFPGANGIPALTCVPLPQGGCQTPILHFPANGSYSHDLPHSNMAQVADIDGGLMDGFVASEDRSCSCTTDLSMGYFDGSDIPTFWRYAKRYTLTDNFFEQVENHSYGSHLAMVSEWSATCTSPTDPMSCTSSAALPFPKWKSWPESSATLPWTDLTYLLYTRGVTWGYYNADGTRPVCSTGTSCTWTGATSATLPIWNPLPWFTDVAQDGQLSNITDLDAFYSALSSDALPQVSWVLPNATQSGHPATSSNPGSEAWVASLLDAIESSAEWNSTAVFLGWDDFGGEYDHVPPTELDAIGLGIRAPEIIISPYARHGFVDSQMLSLDSVNKFIEDDFMNGQRLDPASDGRPDSRPDVRENSPQLGNIKADFNFIRSPSPPMFVPLLAMPATAIPGGTATVTGRYYNPGDTVKLVLNCGAPDCTSGIVVGRTLVQADGTFSATINIPSGTPPGQTWLSGMGTDRLTYFGVAQTNITTANGTVLPLPIYAPGD
jgi:phospholipase C